MDPLWNPPMHAAAARDLSALGTHRAVRLFMHGSATPSPSPMTARVSSRSGRLVAAAKDTSQRAVHERTIATFRAFDRNDRGYITLEDAVIGFRRVAPGVGEGVVADVFREADLDGDGKVTFKDYARITLGHVPAAAASA